MWLRFYPQSYAKFNAGGVSDHARCLVHISDKRDETRKPFKFFNYLKDHEDFLPTVKNFWDISPLLYHSRCSLSMFHRKLKLLKNDLRALNRNHYGDLPNITKQAYEHLCYCQNQVLMDPTPINLATEAEASRRWNLLASIEDKIYRHKSCLQWLQAGDQNTTVFHRAAQSRSSRNTIRSLTTTSCDILTDPGDSRKEAITHFQRFLQTHQEGEEISETSLQELLTYCCPVSTATELVAPVSGEEIKSALHALPNDKVSGPDGFTKEFYVAAWPVIGKDFITTVQSFFLFGFLPTGINATILTLIPKSEAAQSMKDYRPIAFCNLLYKVMSKILARRLKEIHPEAIEPNQSAFIKGRLLLENVLLASELVNGYHKTTSSSRCAIKFDIAKDFDTVKWSFITSVLKAMNLPDLFIMWIKLVYLQHPSQWQ